MITGTRSMPCASCTEPNVKRRSAEIESMPTVPSARPIATITNAWTMEPPDSRDGEGRARAALACHLVPVEQRHDGSGFSGHVHEDRRRGTAVHRAVVDAREHDQRGGGR